MAVNEEVLQRRAALIPYARRGLLGCRCHVEGKPMPCRHVKRDARDPAILLILQEEERSGTGPHTMDFAVAELRELRHEEYGSSPPIFATDAEPASEAKIDVLRQRIKDKQECRHPADRRHAPQAPRRSRFGKPVHRSKKQERQMDKEDRRSA